MNKVFDIVRDRLIEMLDGDIIPWEKNWFSKDFQNFTSKHSYRGMNTWFCAFHNEKHGFNSSSFLSFKQTRDLGGTVKKGEHGLSIFYFKLMQKKSNPDEVFPMWKWSTVFNIEQTNLPADLAEIPKNLDIIHDDVIEGYSGGPVVKYSENYNPCYNSSLDEVHMPLLTQFKDTVSAQATLFHELAHSTGHDSRLERDLKGGFGSKQYVKEELTAEITAAYLLQKFGYPVHYENRTAYIQSWKRNLVDTPEIFLGAASKAEKAADWIIERHIPAAKENVS